MSERRFENLKAGDVVWVVPIHRRGVEGDGIYCHATKVGRKYGYAERHGREYKFCLATGVSVHGEGEGNALVNGRGFDVYRSREQFDEIKHQGVERIRLTLRLGMSRLDVWRMQLGPACVADLHSVLDQHGVDPKLDEKL